MKRSALARKTPMVRKEPSFSRPEHPRAKADIGNPTSVRKAKPERCKHCKKALGERERAIHSACVDGWYAANREKIAKRAAAKNAKAERENFNARREKLKTITEWEHECKAIVQKIARLRDRHDGCISCHMGANYAGQWHGSHFRPAGNHSAVELHLWNIHKACAQCNKYKGGNIAGYRPRLIAKIGVERVQWLESQNQVTRRSVDYLKRFKRVMGKRLRRLEKRIQQQ